MAAPSLFAWSNRVQKRQRVNLEEQDDDHHDNDLTPTDSNEYEMTLFSSSTNNTTTTSEKKQVLLDSTTTTTMNSAEEEKAGIFRNNNNGNKKYDAIISHDNNNNNMHCTPTKKKTGSSRLPSLLVTRITAIASLGGILFGYDMGVIAGALPQLATSFDLNDSQQELVVSILYVGGGLGAAVGGTLCDALGRKVSILYTDVIFMVGALLLATAPALWQVVLGRLIVGFGIAVSGIADVSYLHEIAPTQWRGAIVSVNEACISLGFLMAFCIGVILAEENTAATSGWRIMFGLAGILAAIQLLGMLSMPESPIWLQQKGRLEEAKRVYDYIHYSSRRQRADQYHCADHSNNNDNDDDDNNIISGNDIIASADGNATETTTIEENDDNDGIVSSSGGAENNYFSLYSRQIWIALFLSMTQQFCGQTNVLNYAPIIFTDLDNNNIDAKDDTVGDDFHSYPEDNDDSFYSSHKTRVMIFIGLVKFIVTVLVIWKIEYLGRRFLLLTGMTTISLGLLFVTLAFSMTTTSSWAFSLTTIGILMVVCGYSMSFGPLTWLLTSELFPTHIRGRALGCSTIVTYGCAALVSSTFLSAQTLLGGTNRVFALYLIITVVGIVFVYLAIPDTGHGQTTEEIHSNILQMTWWRRRNSYKQGQQERSLYDHNNASNNNGNNNPVRCTPPEPQQQEIPELL